KWFGMYFVVSLSVFILTGCGGGGGGSVTPSQPQYQVSSTPSSANISYVTSAPEAATSSYTVSTIPPPTTEELTGLEAVDASMLSAAARIGARVTAQLSNPQCTPVESSGYEDYFNMIVDVYNEYRNNPAWPSGVNNIAAGYRNSKSQRVSTEFNVFHCEEEVLNAFAGYRNIAVYNGLIELLDEATDLIYFVDSEDEYDYYLNYIGEYAKRGLHFQIVTPSMHNALVMHPTYGPESSEIFAYTLASVVFHELGHAAMAHNLQRYRNAKNGGTPYDITLLSYAVEFQADIYSASLFKTAGESTLSVEFLLYILGFIGSEDFSDTHPPASYRRYIVSQVDNGNITTASLTPLYTYARVLEPARSTMRCEGSGKLRKPKR
ncbi:MAG: hypothetical protein AB1546_16060, partial [bacterium]